MRSQFFIISFYALFVAFFSLPFGLILADEITTTTEDTVSGVKMELDHSLFGPATIRKCVDNQVLVRGRCIPAKTTIVG
jgi:hypothetical protein